MTSIATSSVGALPSVAGASARRQRQRRTAQHHDSTLSVASSVLKARNQRPRLYVLRKAAALYGPSSHQKLKWRLISWDGDGLFWSSCCRKCQTVLTHDYAKNPDNLLAACKTCADRASADLVALKAKFNPSEQLLFPTYESLACRDRFSRGSAAAFEARFVYTDSYLSTLPHDIFTTILALTKTKPDGSL